MIFSKTRNVNDGEWHCPYSREWLKQVRHTVNMCLQNEQRKPILYDIPNQMEFLSEPQDERGMPLSWRQDNENESCTATYDYCTIPDVVVTNGYDDWELPHRSGRITA